MVWNAVIGDRFCVRKGCLASKSMWVHGIHAWCHANFEYVANPANVEVIKTLPKDSK
jgi:hypothetical protein